MRCRFDWRASIAVYNAFSVPPVPSVWNGVLVAFRTSEKTSTNLTLAARKLNLPERCFKRVEVLNFTLHYSGKSYCVLVGLRGYVARSLSPGFCSKRSFIERTQYLLEALYNSSAVEIHLANVIIISILDFIPKYSSKSPKTKPYFNRRPTF